jgi:hypothetical protein
VKSGICPKCQSHNVYSGTNVFPKSGPFGSNSIPVSLTSIAALNNYVCIDCGYVESYIEEDKLEEIARKWEKAKAPAPSEDEPA